MRVVCLQYEQEVSKDYPHTQVFMGILHFIQTTISHINSVFKRNWLEAFLYAYKIKCTYGYCAGAAGLGPLQHVYLHKTGYKYTWHDLK